MAYRRRHGMTRASTFKEEIYHKPKPEDDTNNNILTSSHNFSPSSSLAAQAIRASAANRESSLSSADSVPHRSKVFGAYEDTVGRNDSKGFWGVLARKAKAILDDDNNMSQGFDTATARSSSRFDMPDPSSIAQAPDRMDHNPTIRKGLDRISTSLNHLGDSFEKAFEEGRTIVENRTADMKEHLRRKGNSPEAQNQSRWEQPSIQASQPQNAMNHENQLKASRDVAMATATKAKLLLRELKTVKADLAFAKQRCSQLEEENKILCESREKGANPADDDLIRLQLETLLAEKARLAHENSVYARENRFLREIVEYHQLTMQDVVYFDEGSEEVTEVHPFTKMLSISPPSPMPPPSPNSERRNSSSSPSSVPESLPLQIQELTGNDVPPNTGVTPLLEEEGAAAAAAAEEDDAEKDEEAKTPAESKGQSGNIPSAPA